MDEIILYQKQNGDIPIKIFLDEIAQKNIDLHAKILQKIDLLLIDKLGNEDINIFEIKSMNLESSNLPIFQEYFTLL